MPEVGAVDVSVGEPEGAVVGVVFGLSGMVGEHGEVTGHGEAGGAVDGIDVGFCVAVEVDGGEGGVFYGDDHCFVLVDDFRDERGRGSGLVGRVGEDEGGRKHSDIGEDETDESKVWSEGEFDDGNRMEGMSVAENLVRVEERVLRACDSVGRERGEVTLVAVSKTVGVEGILEAYEAGVRDFGESRWQELQTKVHLLPSDIRWHFIGKVQSNKAKNIAQAVHTVHTLENERQLVEFAKADRTFDGFLQVNLAKEQQKSGIFVEDLDRTLAVVLKFSQVRLRGLMTIGPLTDDLDDIRALYRQLAELAREKGLAGLSMGMSGDFEIAIQEGATHVRVGSLIFGHRL